MSKEGKISPFDYISAVSHTKKDIIRDAEDEANAEKQYVPFIINKGLSYFQDSVLYANEMNMYPGLPKKAQFTYYLHSLRPRKRFSKWYKPEKDDDIDFLRQYYQCGIIEARQYAKILTKDQMTIIRNKIEGGEIKPHK